MSPGIEDFYGNTWAKKNGEKEIKGNEIKKTGSVTTTVGIGQESISIKDQE